MQLTFEERLKVLIDRSGRPHFAIAVEAGLSPARLSRILRCRAADGLTAEERLGLSRALNLPERELAEDGRSSTA